MCFTALYPNTLIGFIEKMGEAFAVLVTFFQQKNTSLFQILTLEILTKRYLATSLVLDNWALVYFCILLLLLISRNITYI